MAKGRYQRLDHAQVWAFYAGGKLPAEIGRVLGRPPDAIYAMIYKAGGIRPPVRVRSPRQLSLDEREEISRGLGAGESCRVIAGRLSAAVEAPRWPRPARPARASDPGAAARAQLHPWKTPSLATTA